MQRRRRHIQQFEKKTDIRNYIPFGLYPTCSPFAHVLLDQRFFVCPKVCFTAVQVLHIFMFHRLCSGVRDAAALKIRAFYPEIAYSLYHQLRIGSGYRYQKSKISDLTKVGIRLNQEPQLCQMNLTNWLIPLVKAVQSGTYSSLISNCDPNTTSNLSKSKRYILSSTSFWSTWLQLLISFMKSSHRSNDGKFFFLSID